MGARILAGLVVVLAVVGASGCCCGIGGAPSPSPTPSPTPVGPGPGVVVPQPSVIPPPAAAYDPAFIAAHLGRARAEAGCDAGAGAGAIGIFCPALRGWDAGQAAPLPAGPIALVGVTTWIPTAGSFAEFDTRLRRLSFLGLRTDPTGRYGALVSPGSNMAMEDAAVAQALAAVSSAVPTGSPAPIGLSFGLHGFATGQAQTARYVVATTGQGWQL